MKKYIFLTYCEITLGSLSKGRHILQIFDKRTLGNKIILKVYIPQVFEKKVFDHQIFAEITLGSLNMSRYILQIFDKHTLGN